MTHGRSVIRAVILLLSMLTVAGCDRLPETVYVPVGALQEEVEISVSSTSVLVSEKIVLHASRHYSGEWEAVKRNTLSGDDCWMTHPPPAREDEVADNIRWIVTPAGSAAFNVQPRPDHTRTLVFAKPGKYVLKARSATWCGAGLKVRPSEIVILVK